MICKSGIGEFGIFYQWLKNCEPSGWPPCQGDENLSDGMAAAVASRLCAPAALASTLTRPPPPGVLPLGFHRWELSRCDRNGRNRAARLQPHPPFARTSSCNQVCSEIKYEITTFSFLLRRNGQVPRENREFSMDERAAEARAPSGAAWRASLKGASRCLSWGCVEFAPIRFSAAGE